jgi:hypothetical protein
MAVFNSFGQRMATIELGNQQKGKYTLTPGQIPLNFSLFPSGTYVIRLVCNQATAHCTMLVLP